MVVVPVFAPAGFVRTSETVAAPPDQAADEGGTGGVDDWGLLGLLGFADGDRREPEVWTVDRTSGVK